ncbi:MAG: TIGR04338 family metallohydrolase [Mycobacteriales bacterium]
MGTTGSRRDGQRARVYAAEDAWALLLDAARRGARRAEVAGSSVLLPAERHFGTLEAAAAYCAQQLNGLPPVRLRTRRGDRHAHWESPGVIALPVPEHGVPWALRESVLLHELAHHVAFHRDGVTDHGPVYVSRMLELVEQALGAEAALALRVEYGERRVV